MTYEQVKHQLGDYLRCRKLHERHIRELQLIESKILAAGLSIDYSKPKVMAAAAENAGYAEWITEAMFLKKELAAELKELDSARKRVSSMICMVDGDARKDILKYKYLHGWRWFEISKVMAYSEEHTRHLCYEAIKQLTEKITTYNHP